MVARMRIPTSPPNGGMADFQIQEQQIEPIELSVSVTQSSSFPGVTTMPSRSTSGAPRGEHPSR